MLIAAMVALCVNGSSWMSFSVLALYINALVLFVYALAISTPTSQ